MKDNNLLRACVKYCKSERLYHIAIKSSPMLVLCINGRFAAFDMTGSIDGGSDRSKIRACGGLYFSPRNLEEFVAVIRAIQRQEGKRDER